MENWPGVQLRCFIFLFEDLPFSRFSDVPAPCALVYGRALFSKQFVVEKGDKQPVVINKAIKNAGCAPAICRGLKKRGKNVACVGVVKGKVPCVLCNKCRPRRQALGFCAFLGAGDMASAAMMGCCHESFKDFGGAVGA